MEELWWVQHKKSVSTVFVLFYCKTRIMDASQLYSSTGDLKQGSTSSNSNGRARKRSRDVETLSLETRKYPRDLLHSFLSTDPITTQNGPKSVIEEEGDDVEIELNLGLSLDGRFGVNKSHKGLIRASSIAGTIPTFREEMSSAPAPALALARTSSLPVETEEEWRKRKETQSLRRMEAKRRRSEKQRNMKENSICNGVSGEERERQQSGVPGKFNPGQAFTRPGSGGLNLNLKGKCGIFGSLQGLLAQQQQQGCSQGSGESHGGGSSGVSELESKTNQGSGSGSCETRSPASTHSTQERGSQEPPTGLSSGAKLVEGPSKQPETSNQKKEQANGGIEDMPCVFTIGDGPNGRKVEGILYKYGKGEEVRIMCVCHGSFFSPTEFVKHAGGCGVGNPLKHIVVNPSPSPF